MQSILFSLIVHIFLIPNTSLKLINSWKTAYTSIIIIFKRNQVKLLWYKRSDFKGRIWKWEVANVKSQMNIFLSMNFTNNFQHFIVMAIYILGVYHFRLVFVNLFTIFDYFFDVTHPTYSTIINIHLFPIYCRHEKCYFKYLTF